MSDRPANRPTLLHPPAQSKAMADFGDEEYKEMVCVEPGIVSQFHTLHPGHAFVLEQTIRPAGPSATHIGEAKSEL